MLGLRGVMSDPSIHLVLVLVVTAIIKIVLISAASVNLLVLICASRVWSGL